MDAYDNFAACARLTEFVDALSNWYVRRSRDRFWSSEQSADKTDAYWTLYECLLTTCKLIAPFVPFLAEAMWQNLAVAAFPRPAGAEHAAESVHLCDYPSRRSGGDRRGAFRADGAGAGDRLAGPQRPDGREAQGPPAAGAGRGRAGRSHPPGVARRARRADLRRVERQAGRVHREGRPVHHLHRAARPEAAWPAAGQAAAGAAKGCWPRPTAAGCWPNWKPRARLRCRCPTARSRSTPTTSKSGLQAKEGWAAAQGHGVRGGAGHGADRRT